MIPVPVPIPALKLSYAHTRVHLHLTLDLPEGMHLHPHHWPLLWGYILGVVGVVPPICATSWVCVPTDLPRELVRREGNTLVLGTIVHTAMPRLKPLFDALEVATIRITINGSEARPFG